MLYICIYYVYFSIYLGPLQCLTTKFCIFLPKGPEYILLDLFVGIFYLTLF